MSRKLIFGNVSRNRLMDLDPIGVVNGRAIFPLRGAEDDNEGEESESEEDEDDDADDDKDEDDSKAGQAKKTRRPQDDSGDSSVIRTMRKELRALKKYKADNEKAARDKSLADKPELERLTTERDDATKELEKLRTAHRENSIELAIIRASNSARSKYDWADIEDVLNDRNLRNAIEIDEDGEVSGVEEALKDLAKRKPHFLSKPSNEDEKDKGGKGGKPPNSGGNGAGRSGGQPGSGGNGNRGPDREALAKKYPILNRLPK